jgi:hypothetical protein
MCNKNIPIIRKVNKKNAAHDIGWNVAIFSIFLQNELVK